MSTQDLLAFFKAKYGIKQSSVLRTTNIGSLPGTIFYELDGNPEGGNSLDPGQYGIIGLGISQEVRIHKYMGEVTRRYTFYYKDQVGIDEITFTSEPYGALHEASFKVETVEPPPPPPDTPSTITIEALYGGTTDPAPGIYQAKVGQTLSVRALPITNFYLHHWEVDGKTESNINPYPLYITSAEHRIRAHFSTIPSPPPPPPPPPPTTPTVFPYWLAVFPVAGVILYLSKK